MKEEKISRRKFIAVGVGSAAVGAAAAGLGTYLAVPKGMSIEEYEKLKSDYEDVKSKYESLLAAGGVPKEEYEKLKAEYEALKKQIAPEEWTPPPPEQVDFMEVEEPGAKWIPGPEAFHLPDVKYKFTTTGEYKKDPPWFFAMVSQGGGNEWSRQDVMVFKKWCERYKELGLISDYLVTEAYFDPNKQLAQLEDVTARMSEIDALVIEPIDPKAVVPYIHKWFDAGKVVITNLMPPVGVGDKISAMRYSDDRIFGRAAAKWLVNKLKGKGKIINIRGPIGHVVDLGRDEGAKSILKYYPGIEIVGEEDGGWAYDKGKRAAEALLAAHPQIDGVLSQSGSSTAACVDVFLEQGRPLVPMTGEDYNGLARRYIEYHGKKEYGNFDTMYLAYDIAITHQSVELAIKLLTGESIRRVEAVPPPVLPGEAYLKYYQPGVPDACWLSSLFAGLTREDLIKEFGPA
jgi:ribose transport system substrate-binding protein